MTDWTTPRVRLGVGADNGRDDAGAYPAHGQRDLVRRFVLGTVRHSLLSDWGGLLPPQSEEATLRGKAAQMRKCSRKIEP